MTNLYADEYPQDPAAQKHREPYVQPIEGSQESTQVRRRASQEPHATGEHRRIRSTGTDKDTISPVERGFEQDAHAPQREPEDTLPDQLDRNK